MLTMYLLFMLQLCESNRPIICKMLELILDKHQSLVSSTVEIIVDTKAVAKLLYVGGINVHKEPGLDGLNTIVVRERVK